MPVRDVVVVGGSAGGVEALRSLVAGLPADLGATVLVVVHTPATSVSVLPQILGRDTVLPVAHARDGEVMVPGRIYVAVPDHHLLVHADRIRLSRSARQNRVRPAVDALFRSAARWCGPRVIAVVLSGARDDGAAGTAAIHALGGAAVVQDPQDAIFAGMPRAALAAVKGDAVLGSAEQLGSIVTAVARQPFVDPGIPPDRDLVLETDMAESDRPSGEEIPGTPIGLGCPECNGGVSLVGEGATAHYRCHTGHSYSPQTMIDAQREKVESALWTAVSFLEEQAMIHQHLAARATASGAEITADHQRAAAQDILHAAEVLRRQVDRPTPGHQDEQ